MRQKYGSKLVPASVSDQNRLRSANEQRKEKGKESLTRMTSLKCHAKDEIHPESIGPCVGDVFMFHSWVFHPRRDCKKGRQLAKDGCRDPEVELFKDAKVGCDVLCWLAYASWWLWDVGSTLFF